MRAELTAFALEAREALRTTQEKKAQAPVGAVVVSGMLAEQLARELGMDAEPGAVVVRNPPSLGGAEVVVRVIAGDPDDGDDRLVRAADAVGTPVVFVQLWPQANWRAPFVLSPFVVECRAGEGFPVAEIAGMIVRSVARPEALAGRVPVLERPVESSTVASAVTRAALLGLVGARKQAPARPLIALAQLRMLSSLRAAEGSGARADIPPVAVAGATLAASFAFRAAARAAGRVLPTPLANAGVAAAATWALAEAQRRLQSHGRSPS